MKFLLEVKSSIDHISVESHSEGECEIRKFLVDFWGLDKENVEWYKIERMED